MAGGRRFRWSKEDLALLVRLHPDTPNEEIAKALGRTCTTIKQRASLLGLKKSRKYSHELQCVKSTLAHAPEEERSTGVVFPRFTCHQVALIRPTGTPLERAGRVAVFSIAGPRVSRGAASRPGWNYRGKHRGPG